MRILIRPAAAALLIAAGLLSVPAANAQVQSPSPGLSDQSPNIPDQKQPRISILLMRAKERIVADHKPACSELSIATFVRAMTHRGQQLPGMPTVADVAGGANPQ